MIEQADQYKQKLIVEYQRFETMDEQYKALKKSYSKKLEDMERQKGAEVKKNREEHERKLEEKEREVGRGGKQLHRMLFFFLRYCIFVRKLH